MAKGQACVLQVAGGKTTNFELQAQLAKGISDLFNTAINFTNDCLEADDETKAYLNNRNLYYMGISLLRMKDLTMEEFNKTGEDYGKALGYQGYGVDALNQGYNLLVILIF